MNESAVKKTQADRIEKMILCGGTALEESAECRVVLH